MGAKHSVLAEAAQDLLSRDDVIEIQDEEFWAQFWSSTELISNNDLYKAFTADAVREVRRNCPRNLATLVRRAVITLSVHTRQGAVACEAAKIQVTNVIRLLTRLIPLLFEDPNWTDFWNTATPLGVKATLPEGVIDKAYHNGAPENVKHAADEALQEALTAAELPTDPSPPLHQTLLDAILARSIPLGSAPPQAVQPVATVLPVDLPWYKGIEASTASVEKSIFVSRRVDLLRLLIACSSRSLYYTHETLDIRADPWLSYITAGHHRNSLILARSLLNCICSYDPIGFGMPYNYLLVPDADRDAVAKLSGQMLVILLEFVPYPTSKDQPEAMHGTNVFIDWAASLHREEDLDFLADRISLLLNNPLEQTYLPSSHKVVDMHHGNKAFVSRILRTGKVLEITLPILYWMNKLKSEQGHIGFMHICVYALLLLSGQRNFSVRLNKEWDAAVTFEGIPFSSGNYADLVVLVLHGFLTTDNRRLTSLYELILTIIVNISPFLKRLSLQSANKLLHLFQVFSSKKYIFASEPNHRLVFFLLETFNNLIQYQFEGNQHLVYCIIRRRALFYELSRLSLDDEPGEQEIGHESISQNHQQQLKKQEEYKNDKEENAKQAQSLQETADSEIAKTDSAADSEITTANSTAASTELNSQQPTAQIVSPGEPLPPHAKHPTYPSDAHENIDVYAPENNVSDEKPGRPAIVKSTLPKEDASEHFTVADKEISTADSKPLSEGIESRQGPAVGDSTHRKEVGRWHATKEWLSLWYPHLPLLTIQRLLKVLVPQVERLCSEKGVTHEVEVIEFLRNGTLVGLLPVPKPIMIRRYQGSGRSSLWFTAYFWSIIFLKNLDPPFLMDSEVKLFTVHVE